jgi:hypothetical protein
MTRGGFAGAMAAGVVSEFQNGYVGYLGAILIPPSIRTVSPFM